MGKLVNTFIVLIGIHLPTNNSNPGNDKREVCSFRKIKGRGLSIETGGGVIKRS